MMMMMMISLGDENANSTEYFVHVDCGHGSVLLWRGVVVRYVFPVL